MDNLDLSLFCTLFVPPLLFWKQCLRLCLALLFHRVRSQVLLQFFLYWDLYKILGVLPALLFPTAYIHRLRIAVVVYYHIGKPTC